MGQYLQSAEGEIWHHGSPRRWEHFNFEAPKTAGSWSAHLGPHFAASFDTAVRFANGELYGNPVNPGQVVRARLKVGSTHAFDDEMAMDLHALWVCQAAGMLDEAAMVERWAWRLAAGKGELGMADLERADAALEQFLQVLAPLPDWEQMERVGEMLPGGMEPLDLLYAGAEGLGPGQIARAVRLDLARRGFDAITYENSLESEGDPDLCAVVWDDTQIEIDGIELLAPQLDLV